MPWQRRCPFSRRLRRLQQSLPEWVSAAAVMAVTVLVVALFLMLMGGK